MRYKPAYLPPFSLICPFSVKEHDDGEFVFYDGFDVFFVAVSANHNDSCAEFGVNAFVSYHFTGRLTMGTTMVLPMYLLYRSSLGLTSTATHAGINSGRVVAIKA